MSINFIILIAGALVFDFMNGFHDSSNIVATPIASRAIRPQRMLWLAAFAHFIGPFLFGVAVAETIATGITDPNNITITVVNAAMISAIIWNVITWWFGIPSSSSHALIGGIVGAVIVSAGVSAIEPTGLTKVFLALLLSPILGVIVGYLLMSLTFFLARGATPKINTFFKRSQLVTSTGLALSHGANDAQKTMGIIVLGLMAEGIITEFYVPTWVVFISASMIALGTAAGGWRLIRTLGWRIYKVRAVHGFVAQISSTAIILGAAIGGAPVSTTQVMSSSIMGAGSAERVSKVRWQVGYEMVIAWVLTIPVSIVMAGLIYFPLFWLSNLTQ
ncbi:MAG: inorganic phosphate transporter [Candidatus Promineifilaceae bacterium]|nr:inorganic phosphate transporter [Candidatus Promineifilaceae bacterium]